VGEATTGDDVVRLAATLQPDVIVMDIHMPGLNGIEATRCIHDTHPHIRILIVTMFEDDGSVFTAMRAGARGYILKDAETADLLRAIRAVGSGEAIFSPTIATRLLDFFAHTGALPEVARGNATANRIPASVFPELTEREHEVLRLLAQGRNNSEIAAELVLSLKTVRNHVSNIFTKLHVTGRVQAALRARDAGLR
jgi:DNA-binding NarL/FixJ family response regulator